LLLVALRNPEVSIRCQRPAPDRGAVIPTSPDGTFPVRDDSRYRCVEYRK